MFLTWDFKRTCAKTPTDTSPVCVVDAPAGDAFYHACASSHITICTYINANHLYVLRTVRFIAKLCLRLGPMKVHQWVIFFAKFLCFISLPSRPALAAKSSNILDLSHSSVPMRLADLSRQKFASLHPWFIYIYIQVFYCEQSHIFKYVHN